MENPAPKEAALVCPYLKWGKKRMQDLPFLHPI